MNVKVFNLMLGIIEVKFLVQHDSSESKCRLNENVCSSKLKWNHDIYVNVNVKDYMIRVLVKKGYMWNPSTWDFDCDEAYKISENIDIKNFAVKKLSFW